MTIELDKDGKKQKWCAYHGCYHPLSEFYRAAGGEWDGNKF